MHEVSEQVTIYHNPKCGTSRNTLAMIRQTGIEPEVIAYLSSPPDLETLRSLIERSGAGVQAFIRTKEPLYETLHKENPELSDEGWLALMVAHPILINRPIVVSALGVRLCRPSEAVLAILPRPLQGTFTKEDGEVVSSSGAG